MQKFRESFNQPRPYSKPTLGGVRFMTNAQIIDSILPYDAFGGEDTPTGALAKRLKIVDPSTDIQCTLTETLTEIRETLAQHSADIEAIKSKL
jgi:hypothetical protein